MSTTSTPLALGQFLSRNDLQLQLKVSKKTALRIMKDLGAVRFGRRTFRLPADRLIGVTIH